MSSDWDWTFRVGGKVQREIEKNHPENEGIKIIREQNDLPVKEEEGGEVKVPHPKPPPPVINSRVAEAMGKRGWEIKNLSTTEEQRFFKINKNIFEDKEILQTRKEIWDWSVLCVEGEKKNLFCAHLLKDLDKWDINQLNTTIKTFLQTENYREYGQRLERFFTVSPNPGEDIFSFISRVEKYTEEIEKLEHLAKEAGETLIMPRFCQVWKILSAIEKYPDYRLYTERVQQMNPTEWITLKTQDIRTDLHQLHSNRVNLGSNTPNSVVGFSVNQQKPTPHVSVGHNGGGGGGGRPTTPQWKTVERKKSRSNTPRKYPVTEQIKHFKCPDNVCLGHFTHGKCPRISKGKPCHFEHPNNTPNTPRTPTPTHSYTPTCSNTQEKSRSLSPITRITPTHSSSGFTQTGGVSGSSGGVMGGVCGKCGRTHGGVCLWSKRCFVCGGVHAAKVCPKQQNSFEFGRGSGDRRKSV